MQNDFIPYIISEIKKGNQVDEMRALLRADLTSFCRVMFYEIKNRYFLVKPFHAKIIRALEKRVFGGYEKKNLLINMMSRYGKSELMKLFLAWSYCINPLAESFYTSYSGILVNQVSDDVKKVIRSELFQILFPINISPIRDAKFSWELLQGGKFTAAPIGGQVTGFGAGALGEQAAGVLVLDDPLKVKDARSPLKRATCIQDYQDTVEDRVNDPHLTPIILIMHRIHPMDLTGWIKENQLNDWEVLSFPIWDEATQECIYPEKHSPKLILQKKEENPYYYYSRMMQRPVAEGGNMMKEEWFNYYINYNEEKFDKVFITTDTAMSKKKSADFTVFSVWGVNNKGLFMLDMLRGKWNSPESVEKANNLWAKWKNGVNDTICSGFYIEGGSSQGGQALIDLLKADTTHSIPIHTLTPGGDDKVLRLEVVLGNIAGGQILLPKNNTKLTGAVIAECIDFARDMSHDHDDIVDTLIYAINIGFSERRDGLLFTF